MASCAAVEGTHAGLRITEPSESGDEKVMRITLRAQSSRQRPTIERCLSQPGTDIGVHASISVAQALLGAGVVDEFRLVIAPTIAGSGRRLLDGLRATRLEAIRSATLTDRPSRRRLPRHRVVNEVHVPHRRGGGVGLEDGERGGGRRH